MTEEDVEEEEEEDDDDEDEGGEEEEEEEQMPKRRGARKGSAVQPHARSRTLGSPHAAAGNGNQAKGYQLQAGRAAALD